MCSRLDLKNPTLAITEHGSTQHGPITHSGAADKQLSVTLAPELVNVTVHFGSPEPFSGSHLMGIYCPLRVLAQRWGLYILLTLKESDTHFLPLKTKALHKY
jgi:hypothetical protein